MHIATLNRKTYQYKPLLGIELIGLYAYCTPNPYMCEPLLRIELLGLYAYCVPEP
jgi:hypothetical protein